MVDSVKDIRLHLYRKGFDPTYLQWKRHGELENLCSSSYTHNEQAEDDIQDTHNLEVEMEDELGATQDVPPDQVVIDEERNMYESLALSEKNRDIHKKNPYPHYMGRGGYAMLQRELAASQATTSADIAGSSTETGSQLGWEDSWLRGHTPGKQAEVTDPALMEIRDRIVFHQSTSPYTRAE
ncbi:unnamed protein product [Cuscuta campestris]|uniref:Transposase-associated domain-containing protein n=1 Tax=Cuscuta campestris TaxID=132261 RepID=A0A484M4Z1_9ASTE|nr:unnamed protein product [Cuscuta campestris]